MSKTGVATKTMKDPELIEMFNQMMGASEPDPQIVIPKYEKLLGICKDFINLLIKFVKSPVGANQANIAAIGQIVDFIKRAQNTIADLTLPEKPNLIMQQHGLDEINKHPELMRKYLENMGDRYDITELGKTYMALKDCSVVQEMLMTAKNIRSLLRNEKERTGAKQDDLEDPKNLSHKFITRADGATVEIFNFSNMNFMHLVSMYDQDPKMIDYLLIFIRLIYTKCNDGYRLVTSPDIDVEKFSEILVRSIQDIRKHIPRCDKAFDKIEESVKLLQTNFDGYYKDFIQSQNPGIIIENFVLDVAQESDADPQTTLQFRKIISFYKDNMKKQNIKDPKIQKLFEMLGQNLDVLETRGGQAAEEPETPAEPRVPLTETRKKEIGDSFLPKDEKKPPRKPGNKSSRK